MFKRLKNPKGQSTFEYAILIVIIIGALLTIQIYVKRGVQARWRQSTDQLAGDEQFSPGNQNYTKVTEVTVTTQDTVAPGGQQASTILGTEETTVAEDSSVINVNQEFWGQQAP